MSENHKYKIWGVCGHGNPEFQSSDPVDIVLWLHENRHAGYFEVLDTSILCKFLANEFVSRHKQAAVDRLVCRAVDTNHTEGVAKNILDLAFYS